MRQVVVTGGGTGIGRAVAAAFAGAGDEVVITGRRADVLAKTAADLGPSVRPVPFDAADPAQVTAALSDLPPQVHVLVNCAGGNTDIGAPEPADLAGLAAAWRANLDANVLSAVLVTTALRPRLAPGGAVISLSSIAAHRPGAAAYGAAKAAVEAWNLTLAADLGSDRITANVISPGLHRGHRVLPRPHDAAAPGARSSARPSPAGPATRPTSRARWCSWPRPRPATSRARCCTSTAAPSPAASQPRRGAVRAGAARRRPGCRPPARPTPG